MPEPMTKYDHKKGRVVTRPFKKVQCNSPAEVQRLWGLRHFMGARLIRWGVGGAFIGRDKIIGQQESFNLFPAHIRQHPTVDLNARAEHLSALFDHLLALHGVIDDIPIFIGQIVLAHDGTDTLAPATGRFQVGDDFRFIHNFKN